MERSDALDFLRTFRDSLYGCFERRADALFELTDSILTAGVVPSPAHLSLEAVHRRGWGSLYAALSRGRLDAERLRTLLLGGYPLAAGGQPPVYAVDVSVWPRCDAESSPKRGYYYHPSRHSAGQPIVAGWAYQFIAQLGFERDCWVAPVDVRRLPPEANAGEDAAEQVKRFVRRSGERGSVPLFVFDAGYDPVRIQQGLEGCRAQLLVRLRAGRCFYADPVGPPAGPVARAATGRRWIPKTQPRGPIPPTSISRRTNTTATCAFAPGRSCTPRCAYTRVAAAEGRYPSCALR
jgi:DDE superfamily endonuclease